MIPNVTLDPTVLMTVRTFLALVLLSSSLHKVRDIPAFRGVLVAYGLLPAHAIGTVAFLVIAVEASLAVGLSIAAVAEPAALAAAALLASYTVAVCINLLRGRREIDCGCGDMTQRRPLGSDVVLRNLMLILLALGTTLPPSTRALVWIDAATVAGGGLTLFLLYSGIDVAMANRSWPDMRRTSLAHSAVTGGRPVEARHA